MIYDCSYFREFPQEGWAAGQQINATKLVLLDTIAVCDPSRQKQTHVTPPIGED